MINFSLLDEAFPNEDKNKKIKKDMKKTTDNSLDSNDKKEGTKKNDCNSIQAPVYEIPSACDNKQVFMNVINDSMKSDYLKTNDYKKNIIKPYDFDEMDAYLNVNNITTNNPDKSSEYRTTPFLLDYLKSLKSNYDLNGNVNGNVNVNDNNDRTLNIEQFKNNNNEYIKIDNDLILFMFLGIILILLIDQITKLAIAIKN